MSIKIGQQYRLGCRRTATIINRVEVPQDCQFRIPYRFLWEGRIDDTEFTYLYDPTGRVHDPKTFEPMCQDDPYMLTSLYKPPRELFVLEGMDGTLYGPNGSVRPFWSLEEAQEKCEELDWLFHPKRFLEQSGVRD